jgi:SAM-dependent methyltransferase
VGTETKPHYGIWSQDKIVAGYKAKGKADFFATDLYFLSRISRDVKSILDVACAAGSLIEVFKQYRYDAEYVGFDIAPENIAAAKELYPRQKFEVADAATYQPGRKFDLVYCAGTMFHIPEYERVIGNMLSWSNRYVGFEVKFGPQRPRLYDRAQSLEVPGLADAAAGRRPDPAVRLSDAAQQRHLHLARDQAFRLLRGLHREGRPPARSLDRPAFRGPEAGRIRHRSGSVSGPPADP